MSVKRLNYFYGQFLKEKDFKDEQNYHIEALSMHNRNLHSWGIVSGLDVNFTPDKKHVIIEEGMAIDIDGRQIILDEKMDMDLSTSSAAIIFLTISYNNIESDQVEENGIKGFTRILEKPALEFGSSMPADPSKNLFLAKIKLNQDKMGISLQKSERKTIMISGDHIKDKSIALSKIKTKNVVSVNGTISPKSDKAVAKETSESHRFFLTSIIPTSQGILEWRWQTEFNKDKLSYILMLKNLSDKDVAYEIKYYDLSEK